MVPEIVVLCAWPVWLVAWMVARSWSKVTLARLSRRSERLYSSIANFGFVLLFLSIFHLKWLPRLWTMPTTGQWTLAVLGLAGFGFSWWARIHLGANWSWKITLKENHTIVETGPYRLVRHPIYTGLIVAAVATAALTAKPTSIAAVVLIVAGFGIKAGLEERFLRAELGENAYREYRRRTGMLVPRPKLRQPAAGMASD